MDYVGPEAEAPAPQPAVTTPPEKPLPLLPGISQEKPPTGPLQLTVTEAILVTLENNRGLAIVRYAPSIAQTFEEQERATFDPDLTGILLLQRTIENQPGAASSRSQSYAGHAGISQFLPTGTQLDLFGGVTNQVLDTAPDAHRSADVSLTVTQSLLRGFGTDVNLASLRQARLDTETSEYELRGFAEAIISQTEETYWDTQLARKRIAIFQQSLDLAQQQYDQTRQRIELKVLAASELVAAEAEVALRREDLIDARSALEAIQLQMLRFLSPNERSFERELILTDEPSSPPEPSGTLEDHIQLALRMRPDLNAARLQAAKGELQLVKTRNGLLPQLNLFVTLGRTGYAQSFRDAARNTDGNNYTSAVGMNFEYPLGNHLAEAQNTRAVLTLDQLREAISNLAQLAELDVRTAYIEMLRSKELMGATAFTRKLQEQKFEVEKEKLLNGKSTSLLVAATQRDLLTSQIAELQAVINYQKSIVELYRFEGSLLTHHRIAAPGANPPENVGPMGARW